MDTQEHPRQKHPGKYFKQHGTCETPRISFARFFSNAFLEHVYKAEHTKWTFPQVSRMRQADRNPPRTHFLSSLTVLSKTTVTFLSLTLSQPSHTLLLKMSIVPFAPFQKENQNAVSLMQHMRLGNYVVKRTRKLSPYSKESLITEK